MSVFHQPSRVLLLLAAVYLSGGVLAHARPHRRHHHPRRHTPVSYTTVSYSYRAPLLPPREWDGVSVVTAPITTAQTHGYSAAPLPVGSERATASSASEGNRLALSLGTLAHVGAQPADAFNSELFYGGRVSLLMPITENIWLRPGIGYFFRNQSSAFAAGSNTLQNVFEANVGLQYVLLRAANIHLLIGIAQSLQMGLNRVSGTTISASSPLNFSYHVGPSLGLLFDFTSSIGVTIDADATYDFVSPVQPFVGLTGGIVFRL